MKSSGSSWCLFICAFSLIFAITQGIKCMEPSDARLIASSAPLPSNWLNRGWHTGQYLGEKNNSLHRDASHLRGITFTLTGIPIWWLQNDKKTAHYLITRQLHKLLCARLNENGGGIHVNWFDNTAENREELWCQWFIDASSTDVTMFRLKNVMLTNQTDVGYMYVAETGIYFDYPENSRNDVRNLVPDKRKWFRWINTVSNQRPFSDMDDVCNLGPANLSSMMESHLGISARAATKRKKRYFVGSDKDATCSSGWYLHNNKCYRHFRYLLSAQPRAKRICAFFRAHLPIPRNKEEQQYLVRYLAAFDRGSKYWLDVQRERVRTRYVDYSGNKLAFRRWKRTGVASFDNELCAYIKGRRWFKSRCDAQNKIICVREARLRNSGTCGKIQIPSVDTFMKKESVGSEEEEQRIVNGIEAEDGQFPWQVSIRFKIPIVQNGIPITHNCGGTLIDNCWVLTASHCVYDTSPSMFTVRVGDMNNRVHDDGEQEFDVDRIITHNAYAIVPSPRNDIALLRLASVNGKCARFSQAVQPACLPDDSFPFPDGARCQVSGWGATNFTVGQKSASANLEWATLPRLPDKYCRSRYNRKFEVFVDNLMFCAGFKAGGVDACTGDSGGPYICRNKAGNYAVAGIVSFGSGCAKARYPGVYTHVHHYLGWIAATISQNGGGQIIQTD